MLDLLHLSNPAHDDTRTGDSTDMVALDDALRYTVHGVETAESENLIDLTISRQRWYRDIHVSWLLTEHALAVFAGHWTHLTNCLLTRLGVTPVELDSVENFFLNFHAIPTIHVPHFDTGARQLLLSRGYENVGSTEVVFHSLDDLPALDAYASVEPLSFRHIPAWIETMAFDGGLGPGRLEPGALVASMKRAHKFAAFSEGELAGGGAMRLVDDVALFFCDSIAPQYRSRGLHRALINARLHAAKASGLRVACAFVQQSSTSQKNYISQGFRSLYSRETYQLNHCRY